MWKLPKINRTYTILAFVGWVVVYLLQDFDFSVFEFRFNQYAQGRIPVGGEWAFVLNKTLRFLFNDLFSLLFIYGIFREMRYVRVGLWVMGFGLCLLLPAYLSLALIYREEGFNLLTFLHRITMNPWLMLLLIPGIFYQKYSQGEL